MGGDVEAFSCPTIKIIDGETFKDIHEFLFDNEAMLTNSSDVVFFVLLIQSNAKGWTASAIASDMDPDAFFWRNGGLGESF